MRQIILIAHDLRSCHNVGSLLRTAEGLGVAKVFLTGYTPYPLEPNDRRLPHMSARLATQIHKTALGAEDMVPWEHAEDILEVLARLRRDGFVIAGLEQAPNAVLLPDFSPPQKVALLLGREVEGIATELLAHCHVALEIPMFGHKESFNVVQAAAMALYQCRFGS